MRGAMVLLMGCFALLLGLVLMDVSYTGYVVQAFQTDIYDQSALVIVFSALVFIFVIISLIYHQMHAPVERRIKRG